MKLRRFVQHLGRPVTILVIPHTPWPLLRARFSISFALFCIVLWTGFMLWAGYLTGRRADYWITKLDNRHLRGKVRFLLHEITDAREVLVQARDTDRQMRELLGMRNRQDIIEGGALGGPSARERMESQLFGVSPEKLSTVEVKRQLTTLRRESDSRLASFQEISWYIIHQRRLYRATPSIWPANGRVTSPFGYRFSPFVRNSNNGEHFGEFHPGLDIANATVTPIVATADGVVRRAGWAGGYGQMVILDHGHGFTTLYGHTSKIAVQRGDRVHRGDVIAYMGMTGRSTGTHLHYEILRNRKPVNPYLYMGALRDRKEIVARR